MPSSRYLTKSHFKKAIECPAKLYYVGKRDRYADSSFDDPFLRQLAAGGFIVGELARKYFPGGEHVLTKNYQTAVEITNRELEKDEAIIYEAAFQHEQFFIRADIVVKKGNSLELIEVKAKSVDFDSDKGFQTRNGIIAKWEEPIRDVAFQKHVIQLAHPTLKVRANLMLVDKTVTASTDGLNQKFRAAFDTTGTRYIEVRGDLTKEDLAVKLLRVINVDDLCDTMLAEKFGDRSFAEHADYLADHYSRDEKIAVKPSRACKTCEFRILEDAITDFACGYRECWTASLGWNADDFAAPNILELWHLEGTTIDSLLDAGKIMLSEVTPEDVKLPKAEAPHRTARRWNQVVKRRSGDTSAYFDRDAIEKEMAGWNYPLHFIDFETAMPVIPFKTGRRPYEGIAFQFSHHTVDKNGKVRHAGQFLEATPGVFPNYEFARALKRELENDDGTIFRYHNHENTYVNTIYEQLMNDPAPPDDRKELMEFLQSISKSSKRMKDDYGLEWNGDRNMTDLFDLVLRYYYDPACRGSNSIKHVLPATLNNSEHLKQRYSQPIYGIGCEIESLNFGEPRTWVVFGDDGRVIDPYHSLAGVFEDHRLTPHDYAALVSGIDDISDGGAAMAAYGMLQYEDVSDLERTALETALKKYCELDTLAMVMIYEAWKEWVF